MPEEATAKILPLGERLKQHRTERGLSQAQAARELDVARTAYRLWEMEAAKPSPDRWRLIARWLGVSISTMLLAEDLIDAEGAGAADDIAGRTAGSGEQVWDDLAASSPGDFFEQERATIARQTRRGVVTDVESERLTASLERLQTHMQADIDRAPARHVPQGAGRRQPRAGARTCCPARDRGGRTRRRSWTRPSCSRAASSRTASERANGGPVWLAITLHPDVLRVEVADGSVATPDRQPAATDGARWSFMLAAALATRWGSGRETGGYLAWFEIDLPADDSADA